MVTVILWVVLDYQKHTLFFNPAFKVSKADVDLLSCVHVSGTRLEIILDHAYFTVVMCVCFRHETGDYIGPRLLHCCHVCMFQAQDWRLYWTMPTSRRGTSSTWTT